MSGNPLCWLFRKCKNSNKSRSSDSLLEGRFELTWAFVCPGISTQPFLAFPDVFVVGFTFARGPRPSPFSHAAYLRARILHLARIPSLELTGVCQGYCPFWVFLCSVLHVSTGTVQCGCWNLLCCIKRRN